MSISNKCSKCKSIIEYEPFSVKRGDYANKPLCKKCYSDELDKLVPNWRELKDDSK